MAARTKRSRGDTEIKRRLGGLIRRRRLALKMSQSTLAGFLGISYQQLQKYEKGANRPSAKRLDTIANILGVQPDYLLKGSLSARPADADALEQFLQKPEAFLLYSAIAQLPDQETLDGLVSTILSFCRDRARPGASTQAAAWLAESVSRTGNMRRAEKDIQALKAKMARFITREIKSGKLTQAFVARILKTDQARISLLSRGEVRGISFERLFRFLVMLGWNATIEVEAREQPARGKIEFVQQMESQALESFGGGPTAKDASRHV